MNKIILSIIMILGISQAQDLQWSKELDTAKDAKYLTKLERQVIYELNKARSDPAKFAKMYLEPMRELYDGKVIKRSELNIVTQEGVAALEEAIEALNSQKPVGILNASSSLSKAAKLLAKEQSKTNSTGHYGKNGSTPSSRAEKYGKWQKTIGENIAYGSSTPRQIVIDLIIDDGVKGRGHRINIFKDEFKVVGIAIAKHKTFRNVCVMDYAGGFVDK